MSVQGQNGLFSHYFCKTRDWPQSKESYPIPKLRVVTRNYTREKRGGKKAPRPLDLDEIDQQSLMPIKKKPTKEDLSKNCTTLSSRKGVAVEILPVTAKTESSLKENASNTLDKLIET